MTLTLKNVDSATLQVIESLKASNPKLTIKKESEKQKTKKPSKRLLKALEESKQMDKNPHLYPSFDTIAELKEALER